MHNIKGFIDSTRAVPERVWFRQLFQYAIVGAIAAAFDLAVFTFLAEHLKFHHMISTSVSFLVGTAINFFICLQFIFRLHEHSWTVALRRKYLSSVIALGVNLLVMFLLVDVLKFSQIHFSNFPPFEGLFLARCVAICTGFLLNFILTKYYAFKDY